MCGQAEAVGLTSVKSTLRRVVTVDRSKGVLFFSFMTIALVGCCASVPKPDRYFDRLSPDQTVRMFRYAVETKQDRFAYDCMVDSFRSEHSATEFSLALRFGRLEGEPLRKMISNSQQLSGYEPIPGVPPQQAQAVTVIYFFGDDELPDFDEIPLYLKFEATGEGGEWRIDPAKDVRLLESFSGEVSRAPF